jgi:hypothetical protein
VDKICCLLRLRPRPQKTNSEGLPCGTRVSERQGGRERDGGDRADQVGLGAGCGAEEGADRRRQEG